MADEIEMVVDGAEIEDDELEPEAFLDRNEELSTRKSVQNQLLEIFRRDRRGVSGCLPASERPARLLGHLQLPAQRQPVLHRQFQDICP